jgi:hypothetical protein
VNFARTALIALRLLFFAGSLFMASSSLSALPQQPAGNAASLSGPTASLRDILSAACSQSQDDFARFLTDRNRESFARLTPAARVAFMKRFVLLNEAGKPSVTNNPSGRPIVRCDTPAGAAEIQIGGADTRDNMAFLPIELRALGDSSGDPPISVTLGLVRENNEWKILSLGVVLLDLPSLEIEWDSAEADKNEESAIGVLKDLADAVEAYRRKYARLPESLSDLAPPSKGLANAQSAGLVDSDTAAGQKNGYSFRFVVVGANTLGAPAKFQLAATPVSYGRTGRRSFFRDAEGTLRAADHQGAVGSETDPKLP